MSIRLSFLLFAFCLLSASVTKAQETLAKGKVYIDTNKNFKLDPDEKGLAGVPVSNGQKVVLTGDDGSYSIPVEKRDGKVFVIKPSGYKLPVDEFNRPRFYYLHRPNGSPKLEYKGIEPTGELPEAINFPLLKNKGSGQFKVLLFGDPQPYTKKEVEYFDRDIVTELQNAREFAFGITLGDVVGDDLELYKPYSKSIKKIGLPWFNVMGNHDMNLDAGSDSIADETFESTFGPPTYSFNHGKAHFIILDDIIYPRKDGKSGYIGGFTDEQLTFIKNDLKHVPKDHLVVLAFHIPIFMPDEWGQSFRIEDRERLFNLLKDYPNTLSLSAHTHVQQFEFFDNEEGWNRLNPHIHYNVGTTNGDWWSGVPDDRGIPPTTMRDGTPNGYAMLNIDGSEFTIDYKVANKPYDYRMSLWGPQVVPQNSWHGAQFYVNYFLGNKYTEVEYRVREEQQNWQSMDKVKEQDPYISSLRTKWDTAPEVLKGKRPSNPVVSTHLWKAAVPNNLPLGNHTIEIRVRDMFGRTHTDTFEYKVVKRED